MGSSRMTSGLIGALSLVAAAGAFLLFRLFNPNLAFAATGDVGSDSGGSTADETAASAPAPSGVAMQYNALIAQAAKAAAIDPVLLKAICAQETGFNRDAINPEKDFTLNGVTYAQYDRAGQALLVAWMKDGNDPA